MGKLSRKEKQDIQLRNSQSSSPIIISARQAKKEAKKEEAKKEEGKKRSGNQTSRFTPHVLFHDHAELRLVLVALHCCFHCTLRGRDTFSFFLLPSSLLS